MREREYIDWLRGMLSSGYLGDDAAVVRVGESAVLFTTDLLTEGTHFPEETQAGLVGRKAVGVCLSDIAAMGGSPVCAVISVCIRRGSGGDFARELFLGAREIAGEFGLEIVGGDTTSSDRACSVCVAALGLPPDGGAVMRSGAREGDEILVTGALGGSLSGRHLRFVPRVREAGRILSAVRPSSMIDVSDGLACDLGHIVEESGTGAVIFEDMIPVSDDARALSEGNGMSSLEHALHDGEDFELLFTVSEGASEAIRALDLGCGVTVIGRVGGEGLRIAGPSGEERSIDHAGYEHEW